MDPDYIDNIINFLREFSEHLEAEESAGELVLNNSNNVDPGNQPEPPSTNDNDDSSSNNEPPRHFHTSPVSSTSSLDGPLDPLSALLNITSDTVNRLMGTGAGSSNIIGVLIEPNRPMLTYPATFDSHRAMRRVSPWLITPGPNPDNRQPVPIVVAFFMLILMICNQDSPPPGFLDEEN